MIRLRQIMFVVYILKSELQDRYYVGFSRSVAARLLQHNKGANKSTRPYRPWKIVYTELFPAKREAWLRERQIKSYKGGEAFRKLIGTGSPPLAGPR